MNKAVLLAGSRPTASTESPTNIQSPTSKHRTTLQRSREVLLQARNARKHFREKDVLREKLFETEERLETVEEGLKEEQYKARIAELRTKVWEKGLREEQYAARLAERRARVWENSAKQAEDHVAAAEAHLEELQQEIAVLELHRDGVQNPKTLCHCPGSPSTPWKLQCSVFFEFAHHIARMGETLPAQVISLARHQLTCRLRHHSIWCTFGHSVYERYLSSR
eukprot:1181098-Prorocentrum_minimum.AAC.1